MLRERVKEWNRRLLEDGRAEGQLELMRRMADRKFGGKTVERLERTHAFVPDGQESERQPAR